MDRENPVVKELLSSHEEFRGLFAAHQELERQLAEIDRHHYLTPQQELERKRLQKIKLLGRDRMEAIINEAAGRVRPS